MKRPSWMEQFTKPLAALLGALALLTLAACGGGGTGSTAPETNTAGLSISPGTATIDALAPVTFVVSGGVKPYALTSSNQALVPVGGVADDGRFTLMATGVPLVATPVTITVRDGTQKTAIATVTVNGRQTLPLSISPTSADTGVNVPVTFTITGGAAPYTVISSQPSIIPNPINVGADGRFTVQPIRNPTVATTVTLTVRDALNGTIVATLNVRSLPLAVSPSTATTFLGVPVAYQISGGVAPYSVTSSNPTIVADPIVDANGRFVITPLNNLGTGFIFPPTIVLTIRDAAGNQVTSQLTILSTPLSVSPTDVTVAANTPVTFTISGGSKPYTVVSSQPSLVPNPTSIDPQGRFTLIATSTPRTPTAVVVTIRDAEQNVVTVRMTVLPNTPIPLTVLPSTAIVYANTPTTLTIFGGIPPYQAFSSNPAVLPVVRNVVGDQILLAPNNVDVDTPVTITVTDSAGTSVTATITVKPAPLLNTLTITPTPASPGVGCGSAVCAGQTASVTVTVRNTSGAGLQGRAIRFENVQGNYQFITSGPGLPETLANTITVTTGQDGLAIVRLRADVNAPTQVALIRATDLTSGNILNSSFVIAQFTDGAGTLTAIPTTWTLTGANSSSCAANVPVTYYIFGGTPPYRIQSTLPNFVNIVPTLVQTNGGGFTAIVTGSICSPAPGASITITDATGRTIAVQLINALGSSNPATNFRQIQFSPVSVTTPLGCGQSIIEQIVGGEILLADGTITQPTFVVSTLGPNVTAVLIGRTITISRGATGSAISPAIIYVSNGVSQASLSIPVAQTCGGGDVPPVEVLQFTPASPLVLGCTASPTTTAMTTVTPANLTGYTANPVFGGLTASFTGNVLTVTRTITVTAGSSSIPIIVSGNSPGNPSAIPPVLPSTLTGTLFVAPPLTCS